MAKVMRSGRTSSQRSIPHHVPSRPKRADDRVADEQDPVLGAQVGDALDVAVGRQVHAAGADHRLAEEGGHALGADVEDLRLERRQRVVRDRRHVADQRTPVARVRLDPADARAEAVRPVVAVRARDQVRALRVALEDPVAAGELGRGVDRVAAAGGQEDARVGHRRGRGEPLGELVGGPVARSRRRSSRPRACASARRPRRRPPRGRGRCSRTRGSRSRRGSGAPGRRRPRRPRRARSGAPGGTPRPCRRTGARTGSSRYAERVG